MLNGDRKIVVSLEKLWFFFFFLLWSFRKMTKMTTALSDFVLDFLDFIWKFVFVSLIFFFLIFISCSLFQDLLQVRNTLSK